MIGLLILAALAGTALGVRSVDPAWSVLNAGAAHTSADERAKAIHALFLLKGNRRAERMAEQALNDKSADVRAEAATALGRMDARTAIPRLKELLKNEQQIKVVLSDANALYLLHNPAAYEIYYAVLTGERKGQESLVQSQLDILKNRHELEKLAFETGIGFVPYGSMGYEAWKTITHNNSGAVKADAAEKLARDPDPRSGKALVEACTNSKPTIRAAAADALATRGDPRLASALVPLLTDNTSYVRYEAAAALIHLSPAPKRARHQTAEGPPSHDVAPK
jgi:HEAT repeat protein